MINIKEDFRIVKFDFFNINDKQYLDFQNEGEFCLMKGDVEYWKFISAVLFYLFYIYVNVFQVVELGDLGIEIGDWYDMIIVNERVLVIIKMCYDDFDGQFVLYCYILYYEDGGMMLLVEIIDDV